jgi:hypothetical protein
MVSDLIFIQILIILFAFIGGEGGASAGPGQGHGATKQGGKGPTIEEVD